MKTPNRIRMTGALALLLIGLISAPVAQAELVFTFSEAGDGGIDMTASGTSGNISFIVGEGLILPRVDNSFFAGPNTSADTVAGSVDVDATNYPAISGGLFHDFAGDDLLRIQVGPPTLFDSGVLSTSDLTASWDVGTLAFSSLTPGVYPTNLDGITFVVVPEPASAALLALGGLLLMRRRRR